MRPDAIFQQICIEHLPQAGTVVAAGAAVTNGTRQTCCQHEACRLAQETANNAQTIKSALGFLAVGWGNEGHRTGRRGDGAGVFYSGRLEKASEERSLGQRLREGMKQAWRLSWRRSPSRKALLTEAREEHIPALFPAATRVLTG